MIFFPALSAGPIDRIERFRQRPAPPAAAVWTTIRGGEAGHRLVLGLFKKFAAGRYAGAGGPESTERRAGPLGGLGWVLLYAYAFQIFFDFSGYTDIAIGLGRLLGIRLPENFNAPYLKPNLTQFWNNWHMTLTQWFRAISSTRSRALCAGQTPAADLAVILITQMATMMLIGLWHGVTWNFVPGASGTGWGCSSTTAGRSGSAPGLAGSAAPGSLQRTDRASTLFTFIYVSLGWVWFALPDVRLSWRVLGISRRDGMKISPLRQF